MKKTDLNNNDSKKRLTFREIFDLVQKHEEMNREIQMKIDSLNNDVKKINGTSTSKQPNQLKDMLSTILNIIERFEQNGKVDCKNHEERMDILKDFVADFIKDDEQKRIIKGEKIMEKRPFVSEYKNI